MGFKLERIHVWSCEIPDRAGGIASKLAPLAEAGANLEFILTRRQANRPGTGTLLVAPVTGPGPLRAAKAAGMVEAQNPIVLRVTGDDEAGLAHRLSQKWATAGINLQGLTMSVLGHRFVAYAAFDLVDDANKAAQILADLGTVR